MTRVDFYVLDGAGGDPVITACRLCEKAVGAGQRVYVHGLPDRLEALDGALWSFRQGSFLAHEAWHGQPLRPPLPGILLGEPEPPDSHLQVLVNLAPSVPPWFSRFERVLELVHGSEAERAEARARFKLYRDRGYAVQSHTVGATATA